MITTYAVKKKRTWLSLMVLLALTASGYAEEAAVHTRDVVVTASRTEQDVKDTPAAVQVITSDQMEAKGAATLRQALESEVGLLFGQDSSGRSTVSIRGFNARHTLILVDGRRLSGETGMDSVNSHDIDRIRMKNVERIEIVRGAASALYGADALAGVINIITKKPNKPQVHLDMESTKFNRSSADGDNWAFRYDAGQQGKLGWTVEYGERKEDKFTTSANTTNYYGERQPFSFKAVWKADDQGKVIFDFDRMNEDLARRISANSITYYDNTRTNYSIAYEGKSSDTDYQIRAYKSVYDKDYESRSFTTGTLSSFDVARREVSVVEGRITKEWKENHLLTLGSEYRKDFVRGTRISSGSNPFTEYREGRSSSGSEVAVQYRSAYIQDEWLVTDRLLIIPAIRYDSSNKFEAAWSPKLGATYKMDDNNRLKASIGYGFKTPTTTELYHSWTGPGYIFEGNPNLKPEKSKSYEIGWEGEQGALMAKASYFYSNVTDLMERYVRGYSGTTPIYNYRNVAGATLQGMEGEIGKRLNDYITLKVNYTYLDAADKTTNARLTSRPRHLVGMSAHYNDKAAGISATLWGNWKGDYLDGATDKTYGIWNFLVNKELDEKTTLYFGVDNLSNHVDESQMIYGTLYRTGIRMKF